MAVDQDVLELKAETKRTAGEVVSAWKAFQRSVEEVQGVIDKWKQRGFFSKLGGLFTQLDDAAVISEYREARSEARRAVSLGKSMLKDIKRIKDDKAVKKGDKSKMDRIESGLAKMMPPMEDLARSSDLRLWWRQSPALAVLSILAGVAGVVISVMRGIR